MNQPFRPPAVPLVTVDPFFSIWSSSEVLHREPTRHWTLVPHELVGLIRVDGKLFRFLGSTNQGPAWRNANQPSGMNQTDVRVEATRTIVTYRDAGIAFTVTFMTPLLTDDLDVLSRPFSYVHFSVETTDGAAHSVQIYFDAAPAIASSRDDAAMVWEETTIGDGWKTLRTGTWQQNRLSHRGDLTTIDWGYLNVMCDGTAETRFGAPREMRAKFKADGTIADANAELPRKGLSIAAGAPWLAAAWDLGSVTDSAERLLILGYDDGVSIDYFGTARPAYCFRDGRTYADVAKLAIAEFPAIARNCTAFDEKLRTSAEAAGGAKYADLVALAYRQSIAAHKLIADENGDAIFLSKECTSNGSIGTVDVSYPSTPLYLWLEPDLVAGMLRPVLRFAESDAWPAPYAPHDVGTYPRATGQTYGVFIDRVEHAWQMPVEECGNMLVMTAAHAIRSGSTALAERYWAILEKWAEYLIANGLDPENQLCTDDFAGHLARNTNLSIKAILGIASFAKLCEMSGKGDAERYMKTAREYAARWEEMARDGEHYRLTFDGEGTWSLKYNLVWDRILGFNIFSGMIAEKEIAYYLKNADRYGVPLDSRSAFTKTDWLVWASCLSQDRKTRDKFIEWVWSFANETPDRAPFSDWYDTHDAREQSFHNRTVIGGIFMPLLVDHFDEKIKPADRS